MTVPEYTAGEWTAVVRPGFVALLGPQVPAVTVRAVWDAAERGVVDALAVLARDGFVGLPPFAIVAVERRRVHVALRGDVEVEVGTELLASGEVSTWTERVVEDATGVVVRVAGAVGGDELPLAEGVVRASAVRVALLGRDAVAVVGDVALDAVAPVDGVAQDDLADDEPAPVGLVLPAPVEVVPVDAEPADVVPVDAEAAEDVPVDVVPVEDARVALEPLEPEDEDAPDDEPVAEQAHDEPTDDVAAPFLEAPRADVVSPEAALPEVPDTLLPAPPLHAPVADLVEAPPFGLVVAEPAQDEPAPVVPWFPTHAAPEPDAAEVVAAAEALLHAPVTVEGASPDDHDGMTIMSADLASIRDQLPAWVADEPQADAGAGVADVAPARIVLSTGAVVELDRAVLLGRAPQVSRVTNRELPRLVTVPSPQQDISRTHAEVRVEGDVVLVTDLDSTNGVHVSREGQGARRLHPGEATVVEPHEVVDLGDGVTFTVERGA